MLAYKFRLYPNKKEERKLLWTKEVCGHTYNKFLELYNAGERDRAKLQALLPVWKKTDADLGGVHSKMLQYELYRLISNLKALREMKKHGRKVGKLRFKPENRFKTITYNRSGFGLVPNDDELGFLHLSKIGDIPIRLHRAFVGGIKGVTVKHDASGNWYAHPLVDNDAGVPEVTVIDKAVGLDVGLISFIVDSDGNEVENPRHLKQALKRLRREQRRLSKKQKGSNDRERQRTIVARTPERARNQRDDFQRRLSRTYIDNYDLVVTEKLSIGNMVRNRKLARSISDAAWSSLNQKIAYKAENAGELFVQVEPRSTSQICSQCGAMVPMTISVRVHDRPECGFVTGRDHNASLVILDRGLPKVRWERPELTLVDIRPLGHLAIAQDVWLEQ